MDSLNIAFFVSGNGTLFETITQKLQNGEIRGKSVVLISSNPNAGAIPRAKRLGVPVEIVVRSQFSSDNEYTEKLLSILKERKVNFICLAGYLKLLPTKIIHEYPNKILNIHPALLPAFGGKGMYGSKVHEAVIDSGVKITGVTVHLVDEQYDHGPIVLQQGVYVKSDDTPVSLEQRVREHEYRLYPQAVKLFSQGRIRLEGRKVIIQSNSLNHD